MNFAVLPSRWTLSLRPQAGLKSPPKEPWIGGVMKLDLWDNVSNIDNYFFKTHQTVGFEIELPVFVFSIEIYTVLFLQRHTGTSRLVSSYHADLYVCPSLILKNMINSSYSFFPAAKPQEKRGNSEQKRGNFGRRRRPQKEEISRSKEEILGAEGARRGNFSAEGA